MNPIDQPPIAQAENKPESKQFLPMWSDEEVRTIAIANEKLNGAYHSFSPTPTSHSLYSSGTINHPISREHSHYLTQAHSLSSLIPSSPAKKDDAAPTFLEVQEKLHKLRIDLFKKKDTHIENSLFSILELYMDPLKRKECREWLQVYFSQYPEAILKAIASAKPDNKDELLEFLVTIFLEWNGCVNASQDALQKLKKSLSEKADLPGAHPTYRALNAFLNNSPIDIAMKKEFATSYLLKFISLEEQKLPSLLNTSLRSRSLDDFKDPISNQSMKLLNLSAEFGSSLGRALLAFLSIRQKMAKEIQQSIYENKESKEKLSAPESFCSRNLSDLLNKPEEKESVFIEALHVLAQPHVDKKQLSVLSKLNPQVILWSNEPLSAPHKLNEDERASFDKKLVTWSLALLVKKKSFCTLL